MWKCRKSSPASTVIPHRPSQSNVMATYGFSRKKRNRMSVSAAASGAANKSAVRYCELDPSTVVSPPASGPQTMSGHLPAVDDCRAPSAARASSSLCSDRLRKDASPSKWQGKPWVAARAVKMHSPVPELPRSRGRDTGRKAPPSPWNRHSWPLSGTASPSSPAARSTDRVSADRNGWRSVTSPSARRPTAMPRMVCDFEPGTQISPRSREG